MSATDLLRSLPPVAVREIGGPPPEAEPTVCVVMITYNHEGFLRQAVESVMSQETDFPVELLLSEDCSTDGTRHVALELQARYPDRIRLRLPERNLGMMRNFVETMLASRGEFVALLEGDDYWTDARKLQKQVDLLRSRAECSGCFSPARIVWSAEPNRESLWPARDRTRAHVQTADLIEQNTIPTATVVYRAFVREIDYSPFLSLQMGDWPLHILASLRGPVACLDEPTAVYRRHAEGAWTDIEATGQAEANVRLRLAVARLLPAPYRAACRTRAASACVALSRTRLRDGMVSDALTWAWRALTLVPAHAIWRNRSVVRGACGVIYRSLRSRAHCSRDRAERGMGTRWR